MERNIRGFKSRDGHLIMGSHRVSDLAKTYKTPLYLMDESKIRSQIARFKNAFSHPSLSTQICYASKAFLTLAMVNLIHQEGLALDVVSGGELYTAIQANFPMDKVVFHGNNKSLDELKLALDHQVGTIVIDNTEELKRLKALIPSGVKQAILLRVNPGIEAHTHAYIQTSLDDSKFGFNLFSSETEALIHELYHSSQFELLGLHAHIGSQILEADGFEKELEIFLTTYQHYANAGCVFKVLNLGGGFGVRYTQADAPLDIEALFTKQLSRAVDFLSQHKLPFPAFWIEPGRALVAEAGMTVYEIGALKKTASKHFVFVDGSMADGIRTALYQAQYEALLVDKMDDKDTQTYTLAGKACESGDILIHECQLAHPEVGDFIAVLSTGAYHYSMASHYNRLPNPAVLWVQDEHVKVIVERESYDDLLRLDRPLKETL